MIDKKYLLLEQSMGQKKIGIDFDSTIHEYNGWKDGSAYGGLIDGSKEALEFLSKRFKLVIFTARISAGSSGKVDQRQINNIKEWLVKHDIDQYFSGITNVKTPDILAIIDDRAVHFDGDWSRTLRDLKKVKGV
jgi:hypothetical protein